MKKKKPPAVKKKNRNVTFKLGLADAIGKLVDHTQMQQILINQFSLDPNTGWEIIRHIQNLEIYDEEIWIVYKYHCNQDWEWFVATILTNDRSIEKTISKYKDRAV